MELHESNYRILVISNDKYISGLITGYCVANHFTLDCSSISQPLTNLALVAKLKLVIIDIREMSLPLMELHLSHLNLVNEKHAIPVCALHNADEKPLLNQQPWINYYCDNEFTSALDTHINSHVNHLCARSIERRYYDRRMGDERRKYRQAFTSNNITLKNMDPKVIASRDNSTKDIASHQESNGFSTIHDFDTDIIGAFAIDKNRQAVFLEGKNLDLTCKEFKLFNILASFPKRVCSTELIIKNLWPNRARANKSDLYQYMHLLRRKVEKDPDNPRWIETIKGVGYKLHV